MYSLMGATHECLRDQHDLNDTVEVKYSSLNVRL